MKKLSIMLISIAFITMSCSNNTEPLNSTVLNTSVNIYLKNKLNENILASQNYSESSINIQYLVGGKVVGYTYNSNGAIFDNPRGFFLGILSGNETGKGMRVFLNNDISEEYPITYIHWNSTETDTLKVHYIRKNNGNYVSWDKIWLNGILVLDYSSVESNLKGDIITIVK